MGSETPFNSLGDPRQIAVERAISEFRAARPVFIKADGVLALAVPVEGLSEQSIPLLLDNKHKPRLVLSQSKVKTASEVEEEVAAVSLKPFTSETITAFFEHGIDGRESPEQGYAVKIERAGDADRAAWTLTNLAFLLPACVVIPVDGGSLSKLPLLTIDASAILAFRDNEAKTLKIVSRTFVPLEGVTESEFVVFRGGDGLRDQVAVIVSNPSPKRPVLVRIHSACLTGDLFGSLKCDCGDQLRGTVQVMSEEGGGIVLYLDQEGRGNGIANKIRAYGLQAEGFDTYDADAMLGFGQDQRRFDFAAEMLKQLGYTSIRLMTNNPHKIEALRAAGLDVASTHRVNGRKTAHNVKYLAAKRDKAGHLIDGAAGDAAELEDPIRLSGPAV